MDVIGITPFTIHILNFLVHPVTLFNALANVLRDAKSGNFDHWGAIQSLEDIGYIRIWDDTGLAEEPTEADSPFHMEMAITQDARLESLLGNISLQKDGSARAFILEASDIATVRDANTGSQIDTRYDRNSLSLRFFRHFSPPKAHTMGFTSLLHRRTSEGSPWHRLVSFELLSLVDEPLMHERGIDLARNSYVRVERNLCFTERNGRHQALVHCRTLFWKTRHMNENVTFHPFSATSLFATELLRLDTAYCPLKNASNWREMFSLQYLHANLLLYAQFIVAYEEAYVNRIQPLFDPRRSDFKQGHLEEITRNSCHVQEAGRAGSHMIDMVEHGIDVVRGAAHAAPPQSANAYFAEVELEIRGLSKEIKGCIERLSVSLEHDLKFLSLRREMKQTSNVQQLTILATIFLPLSLSAGVLSMQTRFKDLGTLLYDFFGVVVLLGALVVPLLLFLSFIKLATDHILVNLDLQMTSGRTVRSYRYVRKYAAPFLWLGLALLAILILISFIIGMFLNVGLGAKILGYGVAIFSFPAFCVISFFWSIVFLRWLWKLRKRWKDSQRGDRDGEMTSVASWTSSTDATTPIQMTAVPGTDSQTDSALTGQSQGSRSGLQEGA